MWESMLMARKQDTLIGSRVVMEWTLLEKWTQNRFELN